MSMISLERRRSNPKAIYAACMVGLSIGIPAVAVLPRLVDAAESKALCVYNGTEYTIEDDGGDTVAIMSPGKPSRAVPRSEVTIIPRWQIWRY